jgi:hypothetical protein
MRNSGLSIQNSSFAAGASIPQKHIQGMIFTVRVAQVMIDRDLADMYQAENKRLNEQVKRNQSRFPESFRFQLTDAEKEQLVTNCDRFESMKHVSSNPYVFTEQGVSMLSQWVEKTGAIGIFSKAGSYGFRGPYQQVVPPSRTSQTLFKQVSVAGAEGERR